MEELPNIIVDSLNALSQNNGNVDLRDTIGQFFTNSRVTREQAWRPAVDIVDNKESLDIYIDLPSIEKKSIDLDFYNNRLNLKGNRTKKYISHSRHEIIYGKFSRDIILPVSVTNKENVIVSYVDGVLKISVDKMKESQNRFSVHIEDNDTV
jgi:HSP20 family molecular chaperone IbpA